MILTTSLNLLLHIYLPLFYKKTCSFNLNTATKVYSIYFHNLRPYITVKACSVCSSNSTTVISQTPKHVRDMFNFNTTSNPCGYLVSFMSKTLSVVWYFIMDLILPKVRGYFALFESKSTVIFICIHCLIISFKHRKFTRNLHGVFPSPNLNSYIVFH